MDLKLKWLAVILLPFLTACSSITGIVTKSPELASPPKPAITSTDEDSLVKNHEEGAFHVVGQGETLRHICDVYGLDMAKVAKINKILAPHTLKSGETVFLPAQALLADYEGECKHGGNRSEICSEEKATRKYVAGIIRGEKDPAVPHLKFPVLQGTLTSPFGFRWGRFHKGLDISAPVGTSVRACAEGRVIFTGTRKKFRRYGNTVLIDHGKGVYTYYAHLHEIVAKKGQTVRAGQKIATVGNTGRSTGPHLHLEVRVANRMYNPLAYFSPTELTGTRVAKRFADSPMGPVRALWRIPDLLTSNR